MSKFKEFQFRTQPWYDESTIRSFLPTFVPLKTLVIFCFDPRAMGIPKAVAEYFGDEVFPGESVLDDSGNKVGSSATLFAVSNAGGRAISALQSISTMEFLFHIQKVVVVHHSFCGATSFTADGMLNAFKHEHHSDISEQYDHESLCIMDYEKSLKYDVDLLRSNPGVPKHIKLHGFFYNIDTEQLTEVVQDIPAQ